MKKLWWALCLVIPLASLPAQTDGEVAPDAAASAPVVESARLMVLNLYGETLDIQIGEPVLMSVAGLAGGQPSRFQSFTPSGEVRLFFRVGDDPVWKVHSDAAGTPLSLDIPPGSRSILCFGADGTISLTPVTPPEDPEAPMVALLNPGVADLESFQVAMMQAGGQTWRSSPLPGKRMTVFTPVETGGYVFSATCGGNDWLMHGTGTEAVSVYQLAPGSWTLAMALPGEEGAAPAFTVWNVGEQASRNPESR